MYLPLRIIDNEDGPLARQAEVIQLAHSSVKDVLVPRVPESFRAALADMPVYVKAAKEEQKSISGLCQIFSDQSRIVLTLPTKKPESESAFVTEYQGVLAHEVCHSMRARFSWMNTLADALVHEGLSIHFGRTLDGKHGTGYADSLEQFEVGQMAMLLQQAQPHLRSADYDEKAIFQQSTAGYTLGEQVVGLYIAGTGKPAGQLLATPTETFFSYASRHVEQTMRTNSFIQKYATYN